MPLTYSTTGSSAEQKKSENSISVCKPLLLSLTSTIVFSIINIMPLNCYLFISQLTTNFLANYRLTTVFFAKYQLTANPIGTLLLSWKLCKSLKHFSSVRLPSHESFCSSVRRGVFKLFKKISVACLLPKFLLMYNSWQRRFSSERILNGSVVIEPLISSIFALFVDVVP